METIAELVSRFSGTGQVEWIGLRPARKEPLLTVSQAEILKTGLFGDHRNKPGKRTITLIQAEHLPVIASLCGEDIETVEPGRLRRNIVVSGIALLGLRNRAFRIGNAVLHGTGLCAPCSRMEAELGFGGYNAVRGHGGICAEVLDEGTIEIGSAITPLPERDKE